MVVGIHDGHNAAAAVVCDGALVAALQEERLTRVKNQGDAPAQSLREALRPANGDARAARVALDGLYINYHQWQREVVWSGYARSGSLAERLKQRLKGTPVDRYYQKRKADERAAEIERLGFRREQIEPVEHHTAHAAAAYYGSGWREGRTLVMTADGSGDRLSGTVSIGEDGRLTRIAQISEHDSLGRLYAMVTHHLGMMPLEHEYKVMGLAPYVQSREQAREAERLFDGLFEFRGNPLVWRRTAGVPSMYAAYGLLGRALRSRRFDVIAAGLQRFTERMLATWVANAIRETGIRRVACAGGVFMNVKANLALLELEELEELFVFPSCGDESNSIGAAWWVAAEEQWRRGERALVEPLGAIYYGQPVTDAEAEEALEPAARAGRLRFRHAADIEALVAERLAEGAIVARVKGAMEFGARALGNRSILARADRPQAARVINDMVKNRDFWMPFAPSVLAERAEDYYVKPKPVRAAYMMYAFRSQPQKREQFAAAQHPYDRTTRPHEVTPEHNPDYWRLLKLFEERTGEGILLNTSFNLHGEPIVYRAGDAVDVFLRSGLQQMAVGNLFVEKAGT